MCGRYATTRSSADLSKLFEAFDETEGAIEPDYNVAPTDRVPIVRMSTERQARLVSAARWGLVPAWMTDPRRGPKMINARAETIATSRAFAPAFEKRRCLVPADGWFEWVRSATGKQPYFMTRSVMNDGHGMTRSVMNDGHGMTAPGLTFAGIWGIRGDLLTFSIVTTAAVGELARVHERMPLLLPPQRWAEWLTATVSDDLLTPPSAAYLSTIEIRPVGPAVGDVHNDGPGLIQSIDEDRLF
jgi:putative SOS response-associated peptidase YedK